MKYKYLFSIIIPAYNEEKKIKKDIEEAFKYLKKYKYAGEVIVSTDGVTDDTNKIVKELSKKSKSLKLVSKKEKIGKGAAIAAGVKIAQGRYVLFADAGLCVSYSHLKIAKKILDEGLDLAIGSRVLHKSLVKVSQPWFRKIGSMGFGSVIHLLGVPKNINDTQCGFKVYKNFVAKDLFGKLKTKGFMFDLEIILRAVKMGYTIGQFPVSWVNDFDSKFKPLTMSWGLLWDLLKIKFLYSL